MFRLLDAASSRTIYSDAGAYLGTYLFACTPGGVNSRGRTLYSIAGM
jgi:hypothetical protein